MKVQKFKKGDTVAAIDDVIQGKVVAIINEIIKIEDENGFIYSFTENELVLVTDTSLLNDIKVKIKDKPRLTVNKSKKTNKKETILEIDLHIHQITKSNKYLSNTNMLLKQIAHAKLKMDFAINKNLRKVIFIHGIGQGVLKKELLLLLKNYPVKINDASYNKYGRGAMEVTIYQNKK